MPFNGPLKQVMMNPITKAIIFLAILTTISLISLAIITSLGLMTASTYKKPSML